MPDTAGKRKLEETLEAQTVHLKKRKPRKTFLDSRQVSYIRIMQLFNLLNCCLLSASSKEALSLAAVVVAVEEKKSSKKTERIKVRLDLLSFRFCLTSRTSRR
jgi:hypothetical protein